MTNAALPRPTDNMGWVLPLLGRHVPFRRRALRAIAPDVATARWNDTDLEGAASVFTRFADFERDALVTKQSAEALQSFLTRGIDR